jgi:hypothetical protein
LNFHLKFGLVHGINYMGINYLSLSNFHHGTFTPGNFPLTYVLPSHEIYPSLWKFHVRITPPLGIPDPECPLPWNFQD